MIKSMKHIGIRLQTTNWFSGAFIGLLLGASVPAFANEETCLPFGEAQTNPTDVPTLQHGAQLYFNYCSACHSIQYMRYSRLAKDLDLTEAQVMQNFAFTDVKFGDYITNNMPKGGRGNAPGSAEWFGVTPPDLSLTARSRGTDWIYNYLMGFYPDATRPVGWNNLTFPLASMPNPLWERQGLQVHIEHGDEAGGAKPTTEASGEHGDSGCSPAALKLSTPGTRTPQQYSQDIQALTSFLEYVGEPAIIQRESMGVWVLLYLAGLTFLLWLLKNEFWKDVH